MLDRDRLIKILGLTTSSSDGEALSALRKANEIIAGENMTWEEVLAQPVGNVVNITLTRGAPQAHYKQTDDWVAPHLKDKVTIDLMFRAIYTQPRTGNEDFWQWVDNVHNHFNQHGQLTVGQYQAIQKCYRRAVRGAG